MKRFQIFREKAGILGDKRVWVAMHPGYLYTADTFLQLLKILIREWKSDRHLVG